MTDHDWDEQVTYRLEILSTRPPRSAPRTRGVKKRPGQLVRIIGFCLTGALAPLVFNAGPSMEIGGYRNIQEAVAFNEDAIDLDIANRKILAIQRDPNLLVEGPELATEWAKLG